MSMSPEYAAVYNRSPRARAAQRRWKSSLKGKYTKQRERAKARRIEWQFTFQSWLGWWGEDISKRGRKPGDLVMARKGDVGPYSPSNCIKLTHNDNLQRLA